MDALSFMKFWLTNPTVKPHREIRISESTVGSSTVDPEVELCEEEDSFFELEISLTDFSLKHTKTSEERESKQRLETSSFSISKSRVLPFVEITSKPQSPIKSIQKFRGFSFKKSKSVDSAKSTTEKKETNNIRFKIDGSFRKTASIAKSQREDDTIFYDSASPVSTLSSSSSSSSSKRFFSLIKPLYTKKHSINGKSTSSPAREKQRNNTQRQLGKSRSASAAVGGISPTNRVNESLQVQQDGIQSAILHCKKSFHSSRESCFLPRSTSESSSREKLSASSSKDSYLFSRILSDSMSEKSIESLTSIEEQREKITDY